MIFSLLKDFDEKSRRLIENFLLENEATCVSLVSRFLKRDAEIYFASERQKIYAVFSFSPGRQILFQAAKNLNSQEKEILRLAVGKAFDSYFSRAYSIMGTLAECNEISKIAQSHLKKIPLHEQEYNLMVFEKSMDEEFPMPDEGNFKIKGGIQIKCCGILDFDALFPLQKDYEIEEVLFSPEDFNKNASALSLKKNLEQKKIFAAFAETAAARAAKTTATTARTMTTTIKQNGKILSKLTINARGKNFVQLGGIFTPKEFRRKGFAKSLLLSFCKKYSSCGKKIVLFVKKTNAAANALYARCGFKKIADYNIVYF